MLNSLSKSLRNVTIFTDLDKDSLDEIGAIGKRKLYEKNQVIFFEGESGLALFVILSGSVKVSRCNDDGKEVVLALFPEYSFFGEMAILDGFRRSANATALKDSELLIIQGNDFLKMLRSHPEIPFALLKELALRLRSAEMKIKSLCFNNAEGKVAAAILQIADEFGKIKQGVVEIKELPRQMNLANMAGTSRETISRTLHSFSKKGLVELEGSTLRILNFKEFQDTFS